MPYGNKEDPNILKKQLEITKQIAEFAFGDEITGTAENRDIDSRTEIGNPNIARAMAFYRIIGGAFRCREANLVANVVMKLLVSNQRQGRQEAVWALCNALPQNNPNVPDISMPADYDASKDRKR